MNDLRILVVDDHILFREGLVSLIGSQADLRVVGEAGSAEEALNRALELKPNIVLMDIGLPDGSGLEATRWILSHLPDTIVVMLTVYDSDDLLFEAIRAGARGYLLKSTPISKLLMSLRALRRGEAALSRTMTIKVLDEFTRLSRVADLTHTDIESLTAREIDVLRELATGATNREIADRLFIAENTVKNHVRKILDKLNLRNRREAARFARRHDLIDR